MYWRILLKIGQNGELEFMGLKINESDTVLETYIPGSGIAFSKLKR